MGMFGFNFGLRSGLKNSDTHGTELPDIFPIGIAQETFRDTDILSTYVKILTDVVERTSGIPEDKESIMWDNCLQSEANHGLVSLLANAMACQKDLFLVYRSNLIRVATIDEEAKIKEDYEKTAKSSVGVYVSFKKYKRTEILKVYACFEYCVLASLNKTLNLSKAIQFKMSEMRSSVGLIDSTKAIEQAVAIATHLGKGLDVLLDVKDMIETATPDTASTEKAMVFLDSKRAYVLGLPLSYISGVQTAGLNSSGEGDARAVERGLKQYYVSIIRPVLKALLGVETEFKTQDFRQVSVALEALKTFELVSNEFLSQSSKQEIMARMFDLDPKAEQKLIKKEGIDSEEDDADPEIVDNRQVANGPRREV